MNSQIERTNQGFADFMSKNRHHILKNIWEREIIPTQIKQTNHSSVVGSSQELVHSSHSALSISQNTDSLDYKSFTATTEIVKSSDDLSRRQSNDFSQISDLCKSVNNAVTTKDINDTEKK